MAYDSIRVLVIDDTPEVIEMFVRNGHHWHMTVTAASDGASGLMHARLRAFDGIVLDMRLPDISGLSVLQQLRAEDNWTPVVILTGYPSTASILAGGYWGVADYFTKPASTARIAAALRTATLSGVAPTPASLHSTRTVAPSPVWTRAKVALARWADALAATDSSQREIIDLVVTASLDVEGTTLPQFALLSKVLRHSLREPGEMAEAVRQGLRTLAESEALDVEPRNTAEAELLRRFEDPHGLKEESLAAQFRMDTTTVGRHLRRLFGCSFRGMRWAALIRPAVAPVALASEPIGNIAIDSGYAPSRWAQFDRDFRHLVGENPTDFRRRVAPGRS